MEEKKQNKPLILVVDDVPGNIKTLAATLNQDYEIVFATNGPNALKIASSRELNLILLDIVMPEMDGFEVCQKLKADPATQDIPIIFVTAKNEETDETHGFELGAIDYITKPISPPIVQARVATHIELSRSRHLLEEQNKQLIEAAKLKEEVEHIIRHDLKSPINGMISFAEVLLADETLTDDQKESAHLIKDLGYKTLNMVNLSLGMVRMEQGTYQLEPKPMEMIKLLNGILADISGQIKFKRLNTIITLNNEPVTAEKSCMALGEELLTYSLFANLLKNAVEASPRKQDLNIHLSSDQNDNIVNIAIHNMGTVPEAIRDNFFEKYATSGKAAGTGLGTYSAKLIAETQNGGITMQTSDEEGTTITVNLPQVE